MMCGFWLDAGLVYLGRAQVYGCAEASARYAAAGLYDGTAKTRAKASAADNQVNGIAMSVADADIELGSWSVVNRTFTPGTADPNAVRVAARAKPAATGWNGDPSARRVNGRAVAYYNRNVMYVVGSTTLAAPDVLVRDRIIGLGYHPVIRDSTFAQSEAKEMLAIVVSESCVSSSVAGKLTNIAVPVLNYEPYLADDLRLAGTLLDTDYGISTEPQKLTIVKPSHPLAAGLSGNVTVSTKSPSNHEGGLAWSVSSSGGTVIATVFNESTHGTIVCYDVGATMAQGQVCAARRVGFFGTGPSASTTLTFGVQSDLWNANGWKLFDAAMTWIIGTTPTIHTMQLN